MDLSEVVSCEPVGHRCHLFPSHTASSSRGFHIKTFLKKHVFVILSMTAVILGEWKNKKSTFCPTEKLEHFPY